MDVTCSRCRESFRIEDGEVWKVAAHRCPQVLPEARWREVWEAYAANLGRPARLTSQRMALIIRRCKEWPVEDLLDAVVGWKDSPFHRGENPEGRVWDSLELLLRNAEHIENFRDLHRGLLQGDGQQHRVAARFRTTAERFLEGGE